MIGIDIFEVKRVEKLLKRKNFLNRFFSESEIKYIYSKKFSHNTVAGLISAKEAVLKALGIGISTEISLRDVEILHDKGVPFVNIKNSSISKLMKNRDIGSFDLSISHDGGYAISVCETREGIFVTDEMFKEFLPLRRIDFHKGDYGKVLVIGGSSGLTGSILMSSMAALRCGTGLVYVLPPSIFADSVQSRTYEQIVLSVDDDGEKFFGNFSEKKLLNHLKNIDSVAIGMGMGTGENSFRMLETVIENFEGPIVIDADGINCLVGKIEILKNRKNIYLTPHEMEFSRISGYDLEYIKNNREETTKDFVKKFGVNLVLKGNKTIVVNRDEMYVNNSGDDSLATAGAGDVLSGMLASFLAKKPNLNSAKLAVYIHGVSGEISGKKIGKDSVIARDIIDNISEAIKILRT